MPSHPLSSALAVSTVAVLSTSLSQTALGHNPDQYKVFKNQPLFKWNTVNCKNYNNNADTCSAANFPLVWNPSAEHPTIYDKDVIFTFSSFYSKKGSPKERGRSGGTIYLLTDPFGGNDVLPGHKQRLEWVNQMTLQGFNVRVPHMRGMGSSMPRYYCADNDWGFDQLPSYSCVKEVMSMEPPLSYMDLDSMAADLNATMTRFNPRKKDHQAHPDGQDAVFLLAEGFYGYVAQRYLAQYADVTSVTQALMVSTASASSFDLFNAASSGAESAVRRVLQLCGKDGKCASAVGTGISPETLFDQTMRLAKFDKLPCNTALNGKAFFSNDNDRNTNDGFPGNGFVKGYSAIFAALARPLDPFAYPTFPLEYDARSDGAHPHEGHPYVPKNATNWLEIRGHYIPAFLLRLHRCNAQDVQEILALASYVSKNAQPDNTDIIEKYLHEVPAGTQNAVKRSGFIGFPSSIIKYNVAFNELLTTYPLQSLAFNRAVNTLNVDSTPYIRKLLGLWSVWPVYHAAHPLKSYDRPVVGRWYPSKKLLEKGLLKNITFITGELDDMAPPASQSLAAQYFPKDMVHAYAMQGVSRSIPADPWASLCLADVAAQFFDEHVNNSKIPGCVFTPSPLFKDIDGANFTHVVPFDDGARQVFGARDDNPLTAHFTDQQVSYIIPGIVKPEHIKTPPDGEGSSHVGLIIGMVFLTCCILVTIGVVVVWQVKKRYLNYDDASADTRDTWASSANSTSGRSSGGQGFFSSESNGGGFFGRRSRRSTGDGMWGANDASGLSAGLF